MIEVDSGSEKIGADDSQTAENAQSSLQGEVVKSKRVFANKALRTCLKTFFIGFTVATVVVALFFVASLMNAIVARGGFEAFECVCVGVILALLLSFDIYAVGILSKNKKGEACADIEIYSDRLLIITTNKYGVRGEERYKLDGFKAKEKKEYFLLQSPVAKTALFKDGLPERQINAVRRVFGLPIMDGEECVLRPYIANVNTENAEASDGEQECGAERRCIKSEFDGYFSRDKKMLLPQFIIAAVIAVLCIAGVACYCAFCSRLGYPVWLELILWLCAVALVLDSAFSICWGVFVLLTSKNLAKSGTRSYYELYADRMTVCIIANDSTIRYNIEYGKIARIRENKEDIWIDYPTKAYSFPIVKSTLTDVEQNTLRKLLSLPLPDGAQTAELDEYCGKA